ncbi:MAG: hypothetical protein F4190_00800 [Acidimicrobiales bacterium]|nr:hypothetical protein [Acidimicrobiales bacterium]MYG87052.1 hypothetical protein [Acidimicrobiales bacterium]MYI27014.1 hypothetical protein [Acidimicrobiales bacterium]
MRTLPWDASPDLPWKIFTSPAEQWANQPTFLIGEYVIMLCAALALIHALRAGRANRLIWIAALVVGTANDLIFMALPVVDTFWQAQATIMITPRLPLYIPCVYIVFLYWPTVGIRRLGLGRWPAAALTGLIACLLYAPYDIVGAKFLWWTWHDTDPAIAERLLGAPLSSSLWVLTFTGSFALVLDLVLRDRSITRGRFVGSLVLAACITTPLMMAQMFVLQFLDGGVPGLVAFCAGAAVYGVVAFLGRQSARPAAQPVDWLGRGGGAYLIALAISMTFFAPEAHTSTGIHQTPGSCGVTESDITSGTRQKFLCVEDYSEDFTFACTTPPADGTQWYTVCGKEHSNYPAYAVAVAGLALAGTAAFFIMFAAAGRSVGRLTTPAFAQERNTWG